MMAQKRKLSIEIEYAGNYVLTAEETEKLLKENHRFIRDIEVNKIKENPECKEYC